MLTHCKRNYPCNTWKPTAVCHGTTEHKARSTSVWPPPYRLAGYHELTHRLMQHVRVYNRTALTASTNCKVYMQQSTSPQQTTEDAVRMKTRSYTLQSPKQITKTNIFHSWRKSAQTDNLSNVTMPYAITLLLVVRKWSYSTKHQKLNIISF